MVDNEARLDHVVEEDLSSDNPHLEEVKAGPKRNIFKYAGNIDLNKYPDRHNIYPNPSKKWLHFETL